MIRVIISGCNGQMGQVLSRQIEELEDFLIIAGVDFQIDKYHNSYPVYQSIAEIEDQADVIIDFSNRKSLHSLLKYGIKKKVSLVIATTGLSDQDVIHIKKASEEIPIFYSANTSLGINVLLNIVKNAVTMLGDSFDIEIIEKHHNQKLDSPSGTAYMIANKIRAQFDNQIEFAYGRVGNNEKRNPNKIGIHAIRGGTMPGEHTVMFAGQDEILEIKHTALSKKIYANGSIKAARFIVNQNNGLYQMNDLIKNNENG